jgi:hypothetical protein
VDSVLRNFISPLLIFTLSWACTGSDRPGTVQPDSDQVNVHALLRNLLASETSYCRKTHKTLRLEAGIGLPHALDLQNVLLCPVFRNCSNTCRRGLCWARPMQCSAFHLFPVSFIPADYADPIQCAPSFTFPNFLGLTSDHTHPKERERKRSSSLLLSRLIFTTFL